jgi:hypothetical protein
MAPFDSPSSLPWPVIELATDVFARGEGLSGPKLHSAFGRFTEALGSYPMRDKPSRWTIFQRGMESMNEEAQRALLRDLLAAQRGGDDPDVDRLRQLLEPGTAVAMSQVSERLDRLPDWQAVRRDWKGTLDTVESNPDGAIRAARTAFESVCKHICDERQERYNSSDDLSRLYKAAARALDVAPDQHTEQIIKQILSGVSTTVDGLAALRNALSDAHGRGKTHVGPAPRHARLAVNVAFAVATFLIDTHLEK